MRRRWQALQREADILRELWVKKAELDKQRKIYQWCFKKYSKRCRKFRFTKIEPFAQYGFNKITQQLIFNCLSNSFFKNLL